MHVLYALRLIVDGQPTVALEDRGRAIELHRVMVLDRDMKIGLATIAGAGEGLIGIAARFGWRERRPRRIRRSGHRDGNIALTVQVRDVRLLPIFHLDQRSSKTPDLGGFGDDQRNWLAVEQNPVIVKRPKWRSIRSDVVLGEA